MIDYLYRVQIRQGFGRYWQTKYAVDSRQQAQLLYDSVTISGDWQKRLISRHECIAQAQA